MVKASTTSTNEPRNAAAIAEEMVVMLVIGAFSRVGRFG
jgi:hypothetical protein